MDHFTNLDIRQISSRASTGFPMRSPLRYSTKPFFSLFFENWFLLSLKDMMKIQKHTLVKII